MLHNQLHNICLLYSILYRKFLLLDGCIKQSTVLDTAIEHKASAMQHLLDDCIKFALVIPNHSHFCWIKGRFHIFAFYLQLYTGHTPLCLGPHRLGDWQKSLEPSDASLHPWQLASPQKPKNIFKRVHSSPARSSAFDILLAHPTKAWHRSSPALSNGLVCTYLPINQNYQVLGNPIPHTLSLHTCSVPTDWKLVWHTSKWCCPFFISKLGLSVIGNNGSIIAHNRRVLMGSLLLMGPIITVIIRKMTGRLLL